MSASAYAALFLCLAVDEVFQDTQQAVARALTVSAAGAQGGRSTGLNEEVKNRLH